MIGSWPHHLQGGNLVDTKAFIVLYFDALVVNRVSAPWVVSQSVRSLVMGILIRQSSPAYGILQRSHPRRLCH